MHNPRVFNLRNKNNLILARAEVTFDLQQNMHHIHIENIETGRTAHYQYENPNDAVKYIKLAAIELDLHGYDHFIEESMPV